MISPSENLGGAKPLPNPVIAAPLALPAGAPDTSNQFFVGLQLVKSGGGKITVQMPIPRPMSAEQALNLAAWLLTIAGAVKPNAEKEFWLLVEAIKKT